MNPYAKRYARMVVGYAPAVARGVNARHYVKHHTRARTSLGRTSAKQAIVPRGGRGPTLVKYKKSTYMTARGVNYGGKQRLNKAQRSSLNKEQRTLYGYRRRATNINRVGYTMGAASLGLYVAQKTGMYSQMRMMIGGNATPQRFHILGGMKQHGSYAQFKFRKQVIGLRVPHRLAQGARLRKVPSTARPNFNRLALNAGPKYKRPKTFTVHARTGRVRRDYKGRFSGWS